MACWTTHFEASEDLVYIQRDEQESSSLTAAPNSEEWVEQRWHVDMEPAAWEAPIGEIQKMFEDSNGFDLQECLEVMLNTEPRQL
jgi:hypothetical protein